MYLNARAPRLSYFSRSQSVQCDWFRIDCLCNRRLKKWLVQNFVKFPSTSYKAHICPPLPIHISSSNNPAGPDLNQNLNLTWPDVFPMSPCVPLWPLLFFNYFPCLPLLVSFVLFVSLSSFSELLLTLTLSLSQHYLIFLPPTYILTPGSFNIWFHQSLLTKLPESPLFFFFQPISPQTASPATVL